MHQKKNNASAFIRSKGLGMKRFLQTKSFLAVWKNHLGAENNHLLKRTCKILNSCYNVTNKG